MKGRSSLFESGSLKGTESGFSFGESEEIKLNKSHNEISVKGRDLLSQAQEDVTKKIIKELYRPGAEIGDGGTADALRYEKQTGKSVGGKSHIKKAEERAKQIKKILSKKVSTSKITKRFGGCIKRRLNMTERELNELLLTKFPEIKKDFDEYTEWQDGMDTGSFLVVEDVLMEYVKKVLTKKDYKKIVYFCETIEEIYAKNDEYATNVIVVGVLENLKCSEFANLIVDYLLPATRKEFDEIKV